MAGGQFHDSFTVLLSDCLTDDTCKEVCATGRPRSLSVHQLLSLVGAKDAP